MAGSSLSGKHPTIANLYIDLNDENNLVILCHGTGAGDTTANVFQHGAFYNRTDSGTGVNAVYQNTGSSASPVWTLMDTALPGDTATSLVDSNGATVVSIVATTSGVNNLSIKGSATGAVGANAITLIPAGTDAAISLTITPLGVTGIFTLGLSNGTGTITLGSSSAAQTVVIGGGAGVSTVQIAAGAAANLITLGAAATKVGVHGTLFNSLIARNYQATEGGANNAITANLVDEAGVAIPLAAGLDIYLKLAHSLQAGANTFVLNGAGGTKSIKKSSNPANDLAVARVSGSIIHMIYDGTVWQDMSE